MGIIENAIYYQSTTGVRKLSLIAFSGDFDRLTAVFTLATGAAAVGYEVNIFFTFWGLDAIKRKQGRSFTGRGFLSRVFGFMMGGLGTAPGQPFQFHGAGTENIPLHDAQEQRRHTGRTAGCCQGAWHPPICL